MGRDASNALTRRPVFAGSSIIPQPRSLATDLLALSDKASTGAIVLFHSPGKSSRLILIASISASQILMALGSRHHRTSIPVVVVVDPMSWRTTSWLINGLPRQCCLMKAKSRCGAIPYAGAGRVMGDRNGKSGVVDEGLQFAFPMVHQSRCYPRNRRLYSVGSDSTCTINSGKVHHHLEF